VVASQQPPGPLPPRSGRECSDSGSGVGSCRGGPLRLATSARRRPQPVASRRPGSLRLALWSFSSRSL